MQSSSLICQSPTKSIWRVFLKSLSTYATCFLIELCQIIATHSEINFILLWSISCVRPLTCHISTLEDSKYIHPFTHKIKLHAITWLSFSKLPSKIRAMQKEIKNAYPKKVCYMPTRHVKKTEKRCIPKEGMPHTHKVCQKKEREKENIAHIKNITSEREFI